MTPEQLLTQAISLLQNAVNYNLAMQEAFISEDASLDATVTLELMINGQLQTVEVPTYRSLQAQFAQTNEAVKALQVDITGQTALQVLATDGTAKLLFLSQRERIVPKPVGMTVDSINHRVALNLQDDISDWSMRLDISDCKVPFGSVFALAQYDEDAAMLLPIKSLSRAQYAITTVGARVDDNTMLVFETDGLIIGQNIVVANTTNVISNIQGNNVVVQSTLPLDIVGADLYNATINDKMYLDVPLHKGKAGLSIAIISDNFVSEFSSPIDMTPIYATEANTGVTLQDALYGTTYVDQIRNLPKSATVNLPDTTIKPTITMSQDTRTTEVASTLQGYITTFNNNMAIVMDGPGPEYDDAKVAALAAFNAFNAVGVDLVNLGLPFWSCNVERTVENEPVKQFIVRFQYFTSQNGFPGTPSNPNPAELTNDWYYIRSNEAINKIDGSTSHAKSVATLMIPNGYDAIGVQAKCIFMAGQPSYEVETDWTDIQYVSALPVNQMFVKEFVRMSVLTQAYLSGDPFINPNPITNPDIYIPPFVKTFIEADWVADGDNYYLDITRQEHAFTVDGRTLTVILKNAEDFEETLVSKRQLVNGDIRFYVETPFDGYVIVKL